MAAKTGNISLGLTDSIVLPTANVEFSTSASLKKSYQVIATTFDNRKWQCGCQNGHIAISGCRSLLQSFVGTSPSSPCQIPQICRWNCDAVIFPETLLFPVWRSQCYFRFSVTFICGLSLSLPWSKLCLCHCRKETARCRRYPFRFKVRWQHSLQVKLRKPGFRAPKIPAQI